jgi:succinoglycan biosynthesis transport protein ExoP
VREFPVRRNERLPTLGDDEAELVYIPASEEPQLRDYWKMLRKRRRLVVLVLAAALGTGVLVTALTTPQYTAQVTLKIDATGPSVTGLGGDQAAGDATYFQTQIALLKSRALAARVIKELSLESHPKFVYVPTIMDQLRRQVVGPLDSSLKRLSKRVAALSDSAPTPEAQPEAQRPPTKFEMGVDPGLTGRYLKLLDVKPMAGTSLATAMLTTVSPRLSQEMAAAHAANFIRMNLETRFDLTKEAREFLEKKLAELKVKVVKSEEALQRFRQKYGVVSMDGSQNIVVNRMVELNRRLTEAKAKRIELESLTRAVKDKNFEYLSQIIGNNQIIQLKGRLESLEAEQARLATVFKSDHPRLLELKQQINEARRRLRLEIGNVVRGVETDYAAARSQEAALQAEAERQQQAALDVKELAVEYTLLQGELDANRAIYDNVAKRLNETSISNDSPISNIQIIEQAERPSSPSSPNAVLNMMLASALGLFLGVGLAFLLEHFDSSMRTPEDVWRAVAVPTLGVVPHLRALARREYGFDRRLKGSPMRHLAHRWGASGQSASAQLMLVQHPLSFLAESYRTIRTTLLLGHAERSPRVILITSAHPGEGKTTITLNLGIALAQSGRSVVVVDADLRKGNCHSHLGLQNRRGLTHLLTDSLPLDICVQSTAVDRLSLLPRGGLPPNPTELLGSNEMQEMLAALRQRFDFVLVDTPPSMAISDAAVLSVLCDGVLLALRNQSTSTDAARHVVERLQAVGAQILGAVLNGINIQEPYYDDYRHSYSSYYAAAQKEAEGQR